MIAYTICTALPRLCKVRQGDQGPGGCLTQVKDGFLRWSFRSTCIGGNGAYFCGLDMHFPGVEDGNGIVRNIAMRSDRK